MKKLLTLTLALVLALSLAACGTSQQEPSGGAGTQDEKDTAAFAQFGINIESVKADLDGEISTYAVVKDPLAFGANAQWHVKPAAEATPEQQSAYSEQVYNAIKAISDDGEVHGSWTSEQFESSLSLDDAKGDRAWGYLYNGRYVDAYCEASGSRLGINLVYAGQKK